VKLVKKRKDLLYWFVLLFGPLKLALVEVLLTSGFVTSGQQQIDYRH